MTTLYAIRDTISGKYITTKWKENPWRESPDKDCFTKSLPFARRFAKECEWRQWAVYPSGRTWMEMQNVYRTYDVVSDRVDGEIDKIKEEWNWFRKDVMDEVNYKLDIGIIRKNCRDE